MCDDFWSIRLDVYLRDSINVIMAMIRFRQFMIYVRSSIGISFEDVKKFNKERPFTVGYKDEIFRATFEGRTGQTSN